MLFHLESMTLLAYIPKKFVNIPHSEAEYRTIFSSDLHTFMFTCLDLGFIEI